jgi:putative hydrolase of the HAD superfamily
MGSDINFLKERFLNLAKPLKALPTDTEPRLKKLEGIRFLIFDFYGTLFMSGVGDIGIDEDSQDIKAFQDALESCNLAFDQKTAEAGFTYYDVIVERHCNQLISKGFEIPEPVIEKVWLDVLNTLEKEGYIDVKPDIDLARRFSVEFEIRMNPVWPMPSLTETLQAFSTGPYKLGIISNSQFYTPIAFEALAGKSLDDLGFQESLLHWSFVENLKKPSIEFYKNFLVKLQENYPEAKPESVLYTGNDMLKDIYPASTLGMRTALFAGDKRSLKWRKDDERCSNIEPDLVLTELIQLTDCV